MASDPANWIGCFANQRPVSADVAMTAPIRRSTAGGSGAFLAVATDGNEYWVKPLNNCQGSKVPATEQIVARVGALIGAPIHGVRTVQIPKALVGWEFRPGFKLEVGIAHGSLAVPDATETHSLERRGQDTNSSRHAYIHALYDLCWGADPQWLMCMSKDHEYYAHDHGWFLPPEGPDWTSAAMLASLDVAREYADPHNGSGLDREAIAGAAARVAALTQAELVQALAHVPAAWPIPDSDLETAGHFLLHRAPHVASRLRARFLGV
jgi:hypothetical protein